MNTFEIEIDSYTFYISVTDYVNVPAQGKWVDSDWDCYGYEEVEWEVTCVTQTAEDGSEEEITVDVDKYSDIIEDKLLEQIRELKEDECHECDYPEPDYYDY